MDALTTIRTFPFERRCPFDPPQEYAELRAAQPVFPVRLWDGRRSWLVTRYDDARAVLRDSRFSAVATSEGYPHLTPGLAAGAAQVLHVPWPYPYDVAQFGVAISAAKGSSLLPSGWAGWAGVRHVRGNGPGRRKAV